MLHNHMTYPGLAADKVCKVLEFNQTAAMLFGHFGIGSVIALWIC